MTRRIHLGEGVSYSLFAMCVSFVSISRSFWLRLSCRTEVRELRCSETLFTFAFLVLIFPFINLIDMPFIIFIGFIIWKKNILSYPLSAVRSADELKCETEFVERTFFPKYLATPHQSLQVPI
jgi:hypothetical protein